jgi:shikimate kinase
MPDPKMLYFLIGPKGVGKTHIGTLVHQHTDIVFLRVEPIWLSLLPGEDGWEKVETAIDTLFQTHTKIIVESLGVGPDFRRFKTSLAEKYSIKMIHVAADLETCFSRVKNRSQIDHIAVSDDRVIEYNQAAAMVSYAWDLEINNNKPASDSDILLAFQSIGVVGHE